MGKMKDEDIKQHDTLRLWNKVSTTDVDHTKEVSFGRKFTAIDAHSQIKEATRLFGPVGEGWGYTNVYGEIFLTDGRVLACCDVTMWWTNLGHWEGNANRTEHYQFGPVRGGAMMLGFDKGGKLKAPDTDAYKKASTDGLTKLLSHLGFNADVFLGQFDDNKYVQELKSAKQKEASASEQAYQQDRAKFIKAIEACKEAPQMDAVLKNHELWMAQLPVATATEMRSWVIKKKTEIAEK